MTASAVDRAVAIGLVDLVVKTWVILTEAAEGGWGIDGTAYGEEEFAGLARAAGGSAAA